MSELKATGQLKNEIKRAAYKWELDRLEEDLKRVVEMAEYFDQQRIRIQERIYEIGKMTGALLAEEPE